MIKCEVGLEPEPEPEPEPKSKSKPMGGSAMLAAFVKKHAPPEAPGAAESSEWRGRLAYESVMSTEPSPPSSVIYLASQ